MPMSGGGGGGDTFTTFSSGYFTYYPGAVSVGDSDFLATIATLPGGVVLTHNVPAAGDADYLTYYDGPDQIGRLVLHNTTRGDSGYVADYVAATRTISLADAVPAGWQVGDTITLRSQTCDIGGSPYLFDLYVGGFVPATATVLYVYCGIRDTVGPCTLGIHPYLAYSLARLVGFTNGWSAVTLQNTILVPLYSQTICFRVSASAANRVNQLFFKVLGWELPA